MGKYLVTFSAFNSICHNRFSYTAYHLITPNHIGL